MNADSNPIPILTVDDHPAIRQGIVGLIANQPDMARAETCRWSKPQQR
jgi:hypothetical protein